MALMSRAIFDGAGHGPDGTVWGGELLVGDLVGCERAGHLRAVALPGGDRAAREPWRMACAWLVAAGHPDCPPWLAGRVPPGAWETTVSMADTGLSAPPTTSAGRLFDAVAALCGLRIVATYEGQAAMELEAVADPGEPGAYPLDVVRAGDTIELDARPLVAAVADDVAAGRPPATVSARFHNALGAATAAAVTDAAAAAGTSVAVLSGGVFQNRRLLEDVRRRLTDRGLHVLVPQALPPGDGGISYGQAAVAAARHRG
mgnify:CR=1 FL=1